MKLEIPIIVGFDNMESLLDDLKKLQTYKCFEGAEEVLVDIEDVAKVLMDHVKAKKSVKTDDLISRADALSLIASFITQYRKECNVADIYDAILHMTAAQPEIVRCKDCKHYVDVRNRLTVNGSQGKCESLGMMYTHSEWYCGNAEREEDG